MSETGESRAEFLRDPLNRLNREVEMLMGAVEQKDIPEIFDAVTSEIHRKIDEVLEAGLLSDDKKAEILRRLTDIETDVQRMAEFSEKELIMKEFGNLKTKLTV